MAYKKLRDSWHQAIFYMSTVDDRKFLAGLGRVKIEITVHNAREYDPDNLYGSLKPILDALKLSGFIRDDSREWIQLEPVKFHKMPAKLKQTEISINPI
jgi:Holliday junction resolvase RusA-like endonuclease